jgi:hypothetical protein
MEDWEMRVAIVALMLLLAGPAVAQHNQHGQSPYAGFQQREVKALSAQHVADLRAGRGMGLALAAELNGYPGPMHALELAERLRLTAEQKQRLQKLFDAMKAEAIAAGERLIAGERELDREFAAQKISADRLALLTAQIGERQGELRAVHLKYHLITADLLSADQRQRYAELRGYR